MASTSVTVSTEVDIVSDLLKKSFSVRQPSEQNVIVKERPMLNLQATTGYRSFQESWYSKKDWLCGNEEKGAMFCWPCLLFCPGISSSWTKTGFKNMKGFLSDCKKHEKSKSHMGAFKTWKTYGPGPGVGSLISQARRDEIKCHNEEKILEQSSMVYSILQDKETDFQYGMTQVERFKTFVTSLRTDAKYLEFYEKTVEKVGPPVTRYDQRQNYKQLYFESLDSIVGMLTERFQDMERFKFLELVNPRVFKTWKEVSSDKLDLLKDMYGDLFDIPMLVSQLSFVYRDKDFYKDSSGQVLKYIFQFDLQNSIPEVVKLLKMNGVLSVTSASVERSFSCLKRVKSYLRNTMSQGRLSPLCRISIHKDILVENEWANTLHEEVVKRFVKKPRRVAFLYK